MTIKPIDGLLVLGFAGAVWLLVLAAVISLLVFGVMP